MSDRQYVPRASGAVHRDPSLVSHCEACGNEGVYGDPAQGATLAMTDSLVTDDNMPAVVCFECYVMATLIAAALTDALAQGATFTAGTLPN